jgi:hypothetical protein
MSVPLAGQMSHLGGSHAPLPGVEPEIDRALIRSVIRLGLSFDDPGDEHDGQRRCEGLGRRVDDAVVLFRPARALQKQPDLGFRV